ncbi:hypothetical protein TNCV_3764821 [Trichonephila clavipes]|uniref:Uncharacterized protein n=1 Tax=Trichonephila clavipes TaxID=2585209 RepID=A0A8X6VVK8_TRICX|nr:hypothetical protein TNCV_3764821 [Trichonephila clavipes]
MLLLSYQRPHEQPSEIRRGIIIRMMEARWSLRVVACQTQAASSLRACVFPNHHKTPGRKTSGVAVPITCATNTHQPSPPFGVMSRIKELDCNRMDPDHLQQQI